MNYLITGGAGFIGYALAKKLAKNKNDKIYILDLKNKNKILKKKNKKNNLIFVDADIRIKKFFQNFKSIKFKTIYHFAAQTSAELSEKDPLNDIRTNLIGTFNICQFAKLNKTKNIIFTSSMGVYGNDNFNKLESSSCNPVSYYGITKLASEKIIQKLKNNKIKYKIFRLFNVYGPGQDLNNIYQGMVSIYLAQALIKHHVKVKGSLKRKRDCVYIDDVIKVLRSNKTKNNEVYNVGTGLCISVKKIIYKISKTLKKNITIQQLKNTEGDIYISQANIKKLSKTGLKLNISFDTGIKKMIKYYNDSMRFNWEKK